MIRGIIAAIMSGAVALAFTGVPGSPAPQEGVKWDNSVQLVSEQAAPTEPTGDSDADKLSKLSREIAKVSGEVSAISEAIKKDAGLKSGGAGFQPQSAGCDCQCPTLDQIREVVRSELQKCQLTIKSADGTTKTKEIKVPGDGAVKPLELKPGDQVVAVNGQPVKPYTYTGEQSQKQITRVVTPAYDIRMNDDRGFFRGGIRYLAPSNCPGGVCPTPQGIFRR